MLITKIIDIPKLLASIILITFGVLSKVVRGPLNATMLVSYYKNSVF